MSITVVPAYRVVTKFAKQARGLAYEEAVDSIEGNVRDYVRNLLSMLHPSLVELGERSAVTQLGDPEPEALMVALNRLEEGSPKAVIDRVIARCTAYLQRPDLHSRIFLLPGDGESRVLTRQMNGVLAFSLGSQATMVFLWPVEGWERWLAYNITHEYAHLIRNLLFPRGLSGGRLVYMKTQEPETLLDAMVAEGLADAFATRLMPEMRPPWTDALSADAERRLWPRIHRRLKVSDPTEVRRIIFGDNDRVPPWTGYTTGYRIVTNYLKSNPGAEVSSLIGMPARVIYEGSGYSPTP